MTLTGSSGSSAPQTFTITVTAVNDAPSFRPGANVTVSEDDGPQLIRWASRIVPGPVNEFTQTVTFEFVSNSRPGLFSNGLQLTGSGTLLFELTPNRSGVATIVVRAHDTGGTAGGGVDVQRADHLTITVLPTNDPPVARNVNLTTDEDTSVAGVFSGTDPDGDVLTYDVNPNQTNGTVGHTGDLAPFAFAPNADWNGTTTFTYTVSDGQFTATGTVRVRVNAVNDAPAPWFNDDVTVAEGSPSYIIYFRDPDSQPASDYRSTYRTGDGQAQTSGDVYFYPGDDLFPGVYNGQTYRRFGTYTSTATLTERVAHAIATRKVTVKDAPLYVTATGGPATASRGALWDSKTTCFQDSNPQGVMGDLARDRRLGRRHRDGRREHPQGSDHGQLRHVALAVDTSGHRYTHAGTYTIKTTIRSVGGSSVVGLARIVVS